MVVNTLMLTNEMRNNVKVLAINLINAINAIFIQLSINQRILENIKPLFHALIIIRNGFLATNQHIRLISEG